MLDNWIEPIKDQVAFDNTYINWQDFKTKLKEGDTTAWSEFDRIVSQVAREYGKDVEKEYGGTVLCYECEEYIKKI